VPGNALPEFEDPVGNSQRQPGPVFLVRTSREEIATEGTEIAEEKQRIELQRICYFDTRLSIPNRFFLCVLCDLCGLIALGLASLSHLPQQPISKSGRELR
jgi:hypothetical protein